MNSSRFTDACLSFQLKPFLRVSWANEAAKNVWASRLLTLVHLGFELEVASVSLKLRRSGLVKVTASWQHDLVSHWFVDRALVAVTEGGNTLLATSTDDLAQFQSQLLCGTSNDLGTMLDYPTCCVDRFNKRASVDGVSDQTFLSAAEAALGEGNTNAIAVPDSQINILWRSLGVSSLFHMPCNVNCQQSLRQINELRCLATTIGRGTEYAMLEEVLSWPVEWSSLHGIAEVKTPILRFITNSDSLASKFTVRYLGNTIPNEASAGIHFPYKELRQRASESPAFKRGLAQARRLITIDEGRR